MNITFSIEKQIKVLDMLLLVGIIFLFSVPFVGNPLGDWPKICFFIITTAATVFTVNANENGNIGWIRLLIFFGFLIGAIAKVTS